MAWTPMRPPKVFLLDGSASSPDRATGVMMMKMLDVVKRNWLVFVMTMHGLSLALRHSGRSILLRDDLRGGGRA